MHVKGLAQCLALRSAHYIVALIPVFLNIVKISIVINIAAITKPRMFTNSKCSLDTSEKANMDSLSLLSSTQNRYMKGQL